MNFIIQLFRILVGGLFIFSGLIKANDPLGFSYKLDEYFTVFGTEFFIPLSLFLAIFICAYEVIFGFMLLIGAKTKMTLWALLLMILYFTFLTFYAAYFNVVKECGCFGDFLKMTPWQSFTKDVALLVMILVLMMGKKYIQPIFGLVFERILIAVILLFSVGFPLYAWNYLPFKDFRPYAIGKNIQEGMTLPPGAIQDSVVMVFIYEKNGQKVEISYDDVMKGKVDSTYKYVDRIDKVVREGDKPAIHDFSITGMDGTDYTEQILNHDGYYFFLVCYDLQKTDKDEFGSINDFAKLCAQEGIPFVGLTASIDQVEQFRKENGIGFDFFLTDQIVLKTMIRANPGLMLLKKGTVVDMWHYNSFPSFTDVKEKHLSNK